MMQKRLMMELFSDIKSKAWLTGSENVTSTMFPIGYAQRYISVPSLPLSSIFIRNGSTLTKISINYSKIDSLLLTSTITNLHGHKQLSQL